MGVGIQVENLNAWYGKSQALHDINLKVEANHATALIGPSGCGKSTFIRKRFDSQEVGSESVRRTAAAPLYCARAGGPARSAADGRAMLRS